MTKVLSILFILVSFSGFTQTKNSNILTYKEYIFNIINHHPIAKSALLKQKIAKAKLLNAKGNFDPSLVSSIDQKDFKGTEYYNIFKSKITIPTPIGINVTGGFDNNSGIFLNPENTTTGSGLWNAGLEIDLLQGLLTNERRTTLKQAKVFQEIAKNKQQQLLNELIYTASTAYATWQQYNSIYSIILKNLNLSELYLSNTKKAFNYGDKTAMDTLEANVYLQNSKIDLLKYKQLLIEKKIKVENNLWLDNLPVSLNTNTQPEQNLIATNNNLSSFKNLDSIPLIAEKINKKEVLLLKQKLNREKLKPKLKIKYNQLLSTKENSINPNLDVDDYKWGASLTIPLLFRSERGKYRESKYKVEQINYEIAYKKTETQNKILVNQQNQLALDKQVKMLKGNIKGYQQLLDAESIKFEYGESSMFLINKRQEKLIESELKLLKTKNDLITNYLDYLLLTNTIVPKN